MLGTTKIYGCIADPIEHVKAPTIFTSIFKSKNIDAVMVTTPDHMHAIHALPCMQLGKHVYVEKPLTHDIYEARILTEAEKKYKVVTQMGNQGSSGDDTRNVETWIQAGVIGHVHTVHVWTNRPVWPSGVSLPTGNFEVPKEMKKEKI